MKALVETLADVLRQGQKAVLCGIVDDSGSSPRSSGARMLVFADGTFTGSIGGGAVEGACLNEAAALLHAPEKYRILPFELTAAQSAESGMVCGGGVAILLQCLTSGDLPLFEDALNRRDTPMLLTVIPAGAAPFLALWTAADETAAPLPAALRTQLARKAATRRPFRLETEGTRVLAEPLSPPVTVHVAGAGHVGRAIAHLAHFTGFDVVALDDRPEFANAGRFPQAREVRVVKNFQDCLGSLDVDNYVVMDDWADEKPIFPNDSADNNYPFVLGDGRTLYFASKGNGSIGGYDLFITHYNINESRFLSPEQLR